MTTRTITGTIISHPSATIRFRQLHAFVIASATYLTAEYATVTSAAGAFSIAVPVPDTGTVAYLILLPDGMALSVNLASGAATTLEVLIATDQAVVVQSALQTAIDAEALARETAASTHAALRASTVVFGHAAVDGTSITSAAGVLSAAGGAPSGAAGGVLGGTYPNPGFAADMATQAELDTHAALTTSAHGGISASGHTHTTGLPAQIGFAISDETTAITTGTAKLTFRMPFAMTLTSVRASLKTASSSGVPAIDVNEGGVSIFSTTLTIDASEKTSTTAAVAAVISDAALADDAEITVDIDTAGTGAVGLKLWLIGVRA